MTRSDFIRRPTRAESENVIRELCEQYPKCFSFDPKLRRPLKKEILADIDRDGSLTVSPEMIHDAVEWYKSNLGYACAMSVAGAKRIDLQGREVDTVTEQEALSAWQQIQTINQKRKTRHLQQLESRRLDAYSGGSPKVQEKLDGGTFNTPPEICGAT